MCEDFDFFDLCAEPAYIEIKCINHGDCGRQVNDPDKEN